MEIPSKRLNPTNPDHITYQHPPLEIAVLGGIRLEGLDRMRATLKVQVEHLSIRHNLDLYNDTQVEKLVRKIAERLEIGTSVAAAALTDLTDGLEKYRLEEIEKQSRAQDKRKFLTPEEIKAAQVYLKAPTPPDHFFESQKPHKNHPHNQSSCPSKKRLHLLCAEKVKKSSLIC